MESDYMKLSELYTNFLVAVGGVSITVLALVLSFGPQQAESNSASSNPASESRDQELRAFLVAALVVATVSCFIGAQMMAETAAFISYRKWWGERLFLLASANIFIAIALVLFALVLLLTTSGKVAADIINPLAASVFFMVLGGAIGWVIAASISRMPAPGGWPPGVLPVVIPVVFSLLWGAYLGLTKKRRKHLLSFSLIPVVVLTVGLLLYFVCTYDWGDKVSNLDVTIFGLAVTLSYVCLIVAGARAMFRPITVAESVEGNVTETETASETGATQSGAAEDEK
ncbi:MAG TPA: hypothetical protein VN256_15885 [Pyrinomonadaceae bacterium]|nr:hypothetical protein [Pyrinomonadaceae bacterium]